MSFYLVLKWFNFARTAATSSDGVGVSVPEQELFESFPTMSWASTGSNLVGQRGFEKDFGAARNAFAG